MRMSSKSLGIIYTRVSVLTLLSSAMAHDTEVSRSGSQNPLATE